MLHTNPTVHKLVPLSRHSSLPELRDFVSLFKPQCVVPNTLDPALGGLDWACMKKMFAGCLSPSSTSIIPPAPDLPTNQRLIKRDVLFDPTQELERDAALINLEGAGASDTAKLWAESGKVTRKLEIMLEFLEDAGQIAFVESILRGMSKSRDVTAASDDPTIPSSDTGFKPKTTSGKPAK